MSRRSTYDWLISIKPDDLTEHMWAKRAQVNRSWFGDVRKGAEPRAATLERILAVIGYSVTQFEVLKGSQLADRPTARVLPFRGTSEPIDVPLLGTAQASDMEVAEDSTVHFVERMDLNLSDTIDHLRRPPALSSRRDVYAITVVGDSMSPKYEEGDPLYIDPKRQPHTGDSVVVQLKREANGEEQLHVALLKLFVRRTSTYIELRQFNPAVSFQVPLRDVHAVHRVIPLREMVFF